MPTPVATPPRFSVGGSTSDLNRTSELFPQLSANSFLRVQPKENENLHATVELICQTHIFNLTYFDAESD